jgi:hypothetical protein
MQANPTIIWPGAIIDWAGRMAPFSQDANLTRMSGGVADLGDNRWQGYGLGGFLALPGATFQFGGRCESERGFESRRLDSVS